MNVFEYINSKTIADYLKKIEYQFSPEEIAFLIYESGCTLEQKISAWKEVIDTLPDSKYSRRCNRSSDKEWGLHEFLKAYIELSEKLIKQATSSEQNAVFTYSSYYEGDADMGDDIGVYRSIDDCLAEERCQDIPNLQYMRVCKRYIDNRDLYFYVFLNANGRVMRVSPSTIADDDSEVYYLFDDMWYAFPTPFKRGDIVTSKYGPLGLSCDEVPFVLDYLCTWDGQKCRQNGFDDEECRRGDLGFHTLQLGGDSSDMTAYGYFLNDDGSVYNECMHNYLSLEYFDGELKGAQRTLKAISNYHKHEISLELLLRAYTHIIAEEQVAENIKCLDNFTAEGLRLAGVLSDGVKEEADDDGKLSEVLDNNVLFVYKKTTDLFAHGSAFGVQPNDIIVEDGNETYCVKEHCLCSKDGCNLLLLSKKSQIPKGIKILDEHLFAWADQALYPLIGDALCEGVEEIRFRALSIRANYPQKLVIPSSVKKIGIMSVAVYAPFVTIEFLGDPTVVIGAFGTKTEAELYAREMRYKYSVSHEEITFRSLPESEYIDPNHIMVVAKPGTKVAAYCEKFGIPLTLKDGD